jgi:mono/diheme cytochrome c family protein
MGSTASVTEPATPRRPPRWGLAAGLLVVVTAAIFGLGKSAPFKPSADPVAAADGDAINGAGLFATNCAGCHGDKGAGGGVGPKLADVPREAAGIASVIAAGRGAMPAGLVTGTDAADVVAYVISIGGGAAPPVATVPTAPTGTSGGEARFTGDRLSGLTIRFDDPAPSGWSVWVDGAAGPQKIASVDAGARVVVVRDAGLDSLVDGNDSVLVGARADAPSLRADIPSQLTELLVNSKISPNGVGLLKSGRGQVTVLVDHIRFLEKALAEGNLANIRFHGEHMVNISNGAPLKDIDGNGDASNPGDGVGLIGQPDRPGYLPAILQKGGSRLTAAPGLETLVRSVAADGRVCGAAASLAAGRPCVTAIGRRAAGIAVAVTQLDAQVREQATITLNTVP